MRRPVRVVVVDERRALAEALVLALAGEPWIEVVGPPMSPADVAAVTERRADAILVGLGPSGSDGVVRRLRRVAPGAAVLVHSVGHGEPWAAEAARAGAVVLERSRPLSDMVREILAVAPSGAPDPGDAGDVEAGPPPDVGGGAAERMAALLTGRESEILSLLADGRSSRDIAERLVLSPRTVDTHVRNIVVKLGVHSKLEAVVAAFRLGLVSAPRHP